MTLMLPADGWLFLDYALSFAPLPLASFSLQPSAARPPAPAQTTCSPVPPRRCHLLARISRALCVRTSPRATTTALAPVRAAR